MSTFRELQRYVGRPYSDAYNCAHLARDVQAEVFGRQVHLPGVMPTGVAGQRAKINAMRDELAQSIPEPVDGCAVLMSGKDAQGREVLHIGTVALRAPGDPYVLHNSAHFRSARYDRVSDLQRWGLRILGWYAWKT